MTRKPLFIGNWLKSISKKIKERIMKKKKTKKVHSIKATINNFELTRTGSSIALEIKANREIIGNLSIGRGSIEWRGRKREITKRINWTRFGEMMDKLAYGED
jgi:hypothetical protein